MLKQGKLIEADTLQERKRIDNLHHGLVVLPDYYVSPLLGK